MRTCRVRHLPVVAPALVGVLSIRDLVAADEEAPVGDVMSAPAQSVAPAASVSSACDKMLARDRSCLPVVQGSALAGIFTATDALRYAHVALEADARAMGRAEQVAQIMTPRPLVTAAPAATLTSAWRMMCAAGVRHLPVVSDDRLCGILSDRDVLAASRGSLRDHDDGAPAVRVADAMSTRLSTIGTDQPASEAAATLLRRRVGALPVLRGRELCGMLTVADFLHWILAHA
jgi:CBS domain-containing protein